MVFAITLLVAIFALVNCDEPIKAARQVDDATPVNLEGRFGLAGDSGYARKNGYGYAQNYHQRLNLPVDNYGPQTFQNNGQNNQNNPLGPLGQNGFGGVTYGQDQSQVGYGQGQGQFDPNLQPGSYGTYQPANFDYHYGHRRHHRPHGHGYGYYNKYGQDGYGQDNTGYDLQPDYVRFGQGQDNQAGSQASRPSYDSYDNGHYWNKK